MNTLILYNSPFQKKRVGKDNDGGYVIVDLPGDYDILISGGIADDISFEQTLLKEYPNLICHAFDGTINYIPKCERLIFFKKNLGNKQETNLTNLQEYSDYNNIFMKIDIEGHEFRLLHNFPLKCVKQLIIEIHSPGDIQLFPNYFKGLQDITNDNMFNLLNKINETHTLVHFHANNGCKIQKIDGIDLPHVFELTYIRNDFILEKIKNTTSLPTDLDQKNIKDKPDYFLSGFPYTF